MFLSPLFSLLPSFASGVAALVFWAGKSLFLGGWFLSRWVLWLFWPLWTSLIALGGLAGYLSE